MGFFLNLSLKIVFEKRQDMFLTAESPGYGISNVFMVSGSWRATRTQAAVPSLCIVDVTTPRVPYKATLVFFPRSLIKLNIAHSSFSVF